MGILPRFADEWVLARILKATGQAPIRLVVKGGAVIAPWGFAGRHGSARRSQYPSQTAT